MHILPDTVVFLTQIIKNTQMELNCINRVLLCFMPSLEAAIFLTIGLVVQLPQEKWPGDMPQQNITNPKGHKNTRFLLTYLGAMSKKTPV